jgi:hypothetical protein
MEGDGNELFEKLDRVLVSCNRLSVFLERNMPDLEQILARHKMGAEDDEFYFTEANIDWAVEDPGPQDSVACELGLFFDEDDDDAVMGAEIEIERYLKSSGFGDCHAEVDGDVLTVFVYSEKS